MKIRSSVLMLGAMSTLAWTSSIAHAVEVKSPDGRVVLSLEVSDFEERPRALSTASRTMPRSWLPRLASDLFSRPGRLRRG